MSTWDTQTTEDLFRTILNLNNVRDAKRFFRDLLTKDEIIEFGKRWQAARMLSERVPYTDITARTGLSSTTVARISKWLNQGMGGYQLMLQKVHDHHYVHSLAGRKVC